MAACAYGIVTGIRNRLYEKQILPSEDCGLPVVSIGNVTAGGNAKTPLCLYLARELGERGYRPVIVSRGYKGRIKGPHLVTGADTADDVGDEPLLMAGMNVCPVVICRDRLRAAAYIREMAIGDLILLDDGFQHRRIRRQVDVVSVNVGGSAAVEAFLRGEMMPLGFFRENRDMALARADIIILSERGPESSVIEKEDALRRVLPPNLPNFKSHIEVQGVYSLETGAELETGPVVAFCGIANPEGFYKTIRSAGFSIEHRAAFPDHHAFSYQDIDKVRRTHPGIPLVCTEKDAIKLRRFSGEPIYVLKIRTRVNAGEAFVQEVLRLVRTRFVGAP